jgi:folate-binding protein YgfZ
LEEYDALRHGAGAYVVPRDVLAARGPDALSYLQGQCSQDLDVFADGVATDALVLSPQGKVDALVRVTRRSAEEFVLDVDAGVGEALRARLERFRLRVKIEFEPLAWRCVALRGASIAGILATGDGGGGDEGLVLPVAWGGLDGVDLIGPHVSVPPGALACTEAAWEAARIEAGIPRMGAELDGRTIPAEAGLVDRCVSLTKGCYTGQELVARLDARGSNVARRLVGLVIGDSGATVPGALVGAALEAEGSPVGAVTSAAWSPGLQGVVGLGYVHRKVPSGALVGVTPADARPDAGSAGAVAEVRELPLR